MSALSEPRPHGERALFAWRPRPKSADRSVLEDLIGRIGRAQELAGTSGLVSGALNLIRDLVIGPELRLSAKPDWRVLGLSPDWASEWAEIVEPKFRSWANDVDCRSDVSGLCNFAQRLRAVCYTQLLKGSSLAIAEWRPDRPNFYATCIRLVDPDRLFTPPKYTRDPRVTRGIRTTRDGAPTRYYIRNQHPADRRIQGQDTEYRGVPAFTPWGRRRVLHVYDPALAEQHHGQSPLSTILARYKKLDVWEDLTLEAAAVNAMFAAALEMDMESTIDAVGAQDITDLTKQIVSWYSEQAVRFDGVKIPPLFPGQKLNLNRPEQPTAAFADFENAFQRHFAAALNMSYEQFARDYSETNYSGALAGRQDSWRSILSRRMQIVRMHATQEYALWLEEAMDRGDVPMPDGAPSFLAAKTAWTNCKWIGPGQGELNTLQETQARVLKLENGVLTLEDWCAEQGKDWSETLEQRARELQRIQQLEGEYGVSLQNLLPSVFDSTPASEDS